MTAGRKHDFGTRIGRPLGLAAFAAFTLMPILWTLDTSLRTDKDAYLFPVAYWPPHPTFENYIQLADVGDFGTYLFNSLFVSITSGFLALAVSMLGGYALSRVRFPGKGAITLLALVSQMIPGVMLAIPLYLVFQGAGLLNSYAPLVLTYAALATPLCVMLMRAFFAGLPKELEEAARIDGCGFWLGFRHVVLPLMAPGMAATFAFAFIQSWNELILATVFESKPSYFTLPVGIHALIGEQQVFWALMMAGIIVAIVPAVALFSIIQRFLISGLTAGAVKG